MDEHDRPMGLPESPKVERDRALTKLFDALASLAHEATEFVKLALTEEHQNLRRRP